VISKDFAEHIEEGLKIVPYFFHLPMQLGFPFLILLILMIKKRKKSGTTDNAELNG
jgi:spore germination protein KB